jgi:hypothetical protein
MQFLSKIVTALVVSGAMLFGGAPVGAEDTVASGTTEVVAKADKGAKKGANKGKKKRKNKGKKGNGKKKGGKKNGSKSTSA